MEERKREGHKGSQVLYREKKTVGEIDREVDKENGRDREKQLL